MQELTKKEMSNIEGGGSPFQKVINRILEIWDKMRGKEQATDPCPSIRPPSE